MDLHTKPPLSPHLQIYRLPLTALLSITHRATGVILSLAAVVLVCAVAAAADSREAYTVFYAQLASWYGQAFLIMVTFSLYLHFCNGIRHLFWDVGKGFELDTVNKTAKLAIAAAIILTIATWMVAMAIG